MTPERWEQVKEIFTSAMSHPPADRSAFLERACATDYELRSEVESLIASHEKSGEFIDAPAYQDAEWLVNEKAELKPGQKIGAYQVVSFLSRGGMGEVYLAQDQRLNRKVALKVLPLSATTDQDRLRRFEQEARAASALNHPNIITIYDIQEHAGSHVIATEFVEGETLRQRLATSRLSLSETLNICIQVADALSAAHKAGIVHRDIKPDNVMLRPDGYVKVLDFGLAKLSEEPIGAVSTEAPTIQVRTHSGIVMGTAGYMSPEQARGLSVDGRSDVFSLGAMIYEMVARRKPFEGDTASDTMASILKTEPVPLAQVVPNLPAELNRIVSKSLRKDREERYQVVKDLWLDLKALRQELEFQHQLERSTVPESETQATNVLPPAQSTGSITTLTESLSVEIKRHKIGTVVTLSVLTLLLAGIAFGIYRYMNRPLPVEHFGDINIARITNSGNAIDATLSPDGKYVVYVLSTRNSQSVYIRQVNAANDTMIVPPANVGYFGMSFSPDGTELYYAVKNNLDAGSLYRIPVLGGTPIKVLDQIDGPVSFSPDGSRFVFVRANHPNPGESALLVANIDGSGQRELVVKKLPQKFSPLFFTGPSWSPDGKLVAAVVSTVGGVSKLFSYAVEDGKEQELTSQSWGFAARTAWLPDMRGLLLVAGDLVRDAQLWIVSYPEGRARRVTNDLSQYRSISLTADGKKFSTIQAQGLVNLWIVPGGDATKATRLETGNVGFYSSGGNPVTWLTDGRLVFASNEGGYLNLWTMDKDGNDRKQLTPNGAQNISPMGTPDGKYIVYSSDRGGVRTIWRMNRDGSNQVRLTTGPNDVSPTVTQDSKWVIYGDLARSEPTIWKVPIEGGPVQQVINHRAAGPSVSPDGKLLLFSFAESPDPYAPPNRIAVMSLDGDGELRILEIAPNSTVAIANQWAADGKSVLYSVTANNVSNIWSQPIDGGSPKQVTEFKDSLINGFAWSNDGKELVCARGVLLRDAVLITDVK